MDYHQIRLRPRSEQIHSCPDSKVVHFLYAQVIGIRPPSKPTEIDLPKYFATKLAEPDIFYQDEEAIYSLPPSYDTAEDITWLEESLVTQQNLVVHYTPSPTGSTAVWTTHTRGS